MEAKTHQGYFAEGLVASIATAAGLDVSFPRLGHVIDLGIYKPRPKGTSGSRQINLQVKSWRYAELSADGYFHYPLTNSAYIHLATNKHDVRHYLILVAVPPESANYAVCEPEYMRLHHAAYWLSLREHTPSPILNPDSTTTVLVPANQLVTPETLQYLVDGDESKAVVE